MKPGKDPIVVLVFIALALGFYFLSARDERAADEKWARVVDVIDGDTVIIDDSRGSHVRYLGIDTPEIPIQEVRDFNSRLVERKRVRLEFDKEKYDRYGRFLAHVFADGVHVNEEMLRNGYGTPFIIGPNTKYSELLYSAVEEAKRGKRGDLAGFE